jgi:hypothetical protein
VTETFRTPGDRLRWQLRFLHAERSADTAGRFLPAVTGTIRQLRTHPEISPVVRDRFAGPEPALRAAAGAGRPTVTPTSRRLRPLASLRRVIARFVAWMDAPRRGYGPAGFAPLDAADSLSEEHDPDEDFKWLIPPHPTPDAGLWAEPGHQRRRATAEGGRGPHAGREWLS